MLGLQEFFQSALDSGNVHSFLRNKIPADVADVLQLFEESVAVGDGGQDAERTTKFVGEVFKLLGCLGLRLRLGGRLRSWLR
ncbi:hypothetical protein RvY_04577 [Ramazzottius varieornatus]|uniref:Uncharacterized protein n=1 Tax=Ramazzottius varieornatus TaxID=947166 RepID=A0A1D1USQ1_RAMVA|nr:hypothetical protein RvY_04577 [Ramazzottius varieornatus]